MGFWFVSFVWGWLTLLPHALGASAPKVENKVLRRSGLALFALGLATEVMADFQKFFFKRNHKGFCDVGLWSVSQHPNWFGNLCLWSGITLIQRAGALARETGARGGLAGLPGGVVWCPGLGVPDAGRGAVAGALRLGPALRRVFGEHAFIAARASRAAAAGR